MNIVLIYYNVSRIRMRIFNKIIFLSKKMIKKKKKKNQIKTIIINISKNQNKIKINNAIIKENNCKISSK